MDWKWRPTPPELHRRLRPAGNGRIVLGRHYINSNTRYSSVTIDELVFFNQSLKSTEVQHIFKGF